MKKIITLRLIAGVETQEILRYVQYTTEIPIEFHFTDYKIPEGATARFYVLKPSGKEVYNECAVSGNIVTLNPTAQTFAEYGRQSAQLQITAESKVLVSYIIRCDIEKNIIAESAIESKDEFGVLDSLVEEARKKIAESTEATSEAKSATEKATQATSDATEAKTAAQTAADNAMAAETAAKAATKEATDAAAKAKEETGKATAATEAATTATQAANEAAEQVQEMITAGRGLVPEGGTENQVLATDATGAAKWSSDLKVSTLTAGGVDLTITDEEYTQLMTLLGEE